MAIQKAWHSFYINLFLNQFLKNFDFKTKIEDHFRV